MKHKEALAGHRGDGRIVWLDILRAIAVLLVVWGHVFIVGVNDPSTPGHWLPTVQGYVFGPEASAASPHAHAVTALRDYLGINVGGSGGAIFFLVSGFIILRTVDQTDAWNFLVRRAIRILPVCMVAVFATALLTYVYAARAGVRQPHGIVDVLASSVAMAELLGRFPTIPVLWTLAVELFFYLAIAALTLRVGRIGLRHLTGLALGCVIFLLVVRSTTAGAFLLPSLYLKLNFLAETGIYITFMLLGSVVYRAQSDRQWGRGLFHFLAIGLLFLAGYQEYRGPLDLHFRITLFDAAFALALFLLAFRLKPAGRWTAPMRWLADVSYPLYLVHVPLGWAVLAALAATGMGISAAGAIATAVTVLAAWLLHVAVEQPAHRLGRRVAPGRRQPTPLQRKNAPAAPPRSAVSMATESH